MEVEGQQRGVDSTAAAERGRVVPGLPAGVDLGSFDVDRGGRALFVMLVALGVLKCEANPSGQADAANLGDLPAHVGTETPQGPEKSYGRVNFENPGLDGVDVLGVAQQPGAIINVELLRGASVVGESYTQTAGSDGRFNFHVDFTGAQYGDVVEVTGASSKVFTCKLAPQGDIPAMPTPHPQF